MNKKEEKSTYEEKWMQRELQKDLDQINQASLNQLYNSLRISGTPHFYTRVFNNNEYNLQSDVPIDPNNDVQQPSQTWYASGLMSAGSEPNDCPRELKSQDDCRAIKDQIRPGIKSAKIRFENQEDFEGMADEYFYKESVTKNNGLQTPNVKSNKSGVDLITIHNCNDCPFLRCATLNDKEKSVSCSLNIEQEFLVNIENYEEEIIKNLNTNCKLEKVFVIQITKH